MDWWIEISCSVVIIVQRNLVDLKWNPRVSLAKTIMSCATHRYTTFLCIYIYIYIQIDIDRVIEVQSLSRCCDRFERDRLWCCIAVWAVGIPTNVRPSSAYLRIKIVRLDKNTRVRSDRRFVRYRWARVMWGGRTWDHHSVHVDTFPDTREMRIWRDEALHCGRSRWDSQDRPHGFGSSIE